MAWTYTEDPINVPRDEVRVLIGDTDSADPLIADEVIDYALTKGSSVYAASVAAKAIAAKFARLVTNSVGSVSESASDLYAHYKELAERLESESYALAAPSFGGLTIAEHERDAADTGLVQATAQRDQFDNPLAVTSHDASESDR
jgi:hypothetical protein